MTSCRTRNASPIVAGSAPRADTLTARLPGEPLAHRRDLQRSHHGGPRIGVLALQGDVLEHVRMLEQAGARARLVMRPGELAAIDGLLIPGGESTTIGKLIQRYGLFDPLRAALEAGLPAFGTCAGAILLGHQALLPDGAPSPQPLLGVMDTVLRRNAFGRQVTSFEGPVQIRGVAGGPMHAVFIRAPWFEKTGTEVIPLATVPTPLGDKVIVAQQGQRLASAFHPELSGDPRLHILFAEIVGRASS